MMPGIPQENYKYLQQSLQQTWSCSFSSSTIKCCAAAFGSPSFAFVGDSSSLPSGESSNLRYGESSKLVSFPVFSDGSLVASNIFLTSCLNFFLSLLLLSCLLQDLRISVISNPLDVIVWKSPILSYLPFFKTSILFASYKNCSQCVTRMTNLSARAS